MASKMNPVVHFEMPAKDTARMAKFYTEAFVWRTQQLGEEMGNYVRAKTTETDEQGYPKERGQINGGFFPLSPDQPQKHPSVVIAVDNLSESMERVNASGGKVLTEPMEIHGVGTFASFTDTEGNMVGMLQPNM